MAQNPFQAIQKISKIYQAMTDRESLQGYFLLSLCDLLSVQSYALYLAGGEDKLWLESSQDIEEASLQRIQSISEGVQISGKPFHHKNLIGVPLLTGHSCLGVVCLEGPKRHLFSDEDIEVATSLAMEFASAIRSLDLMRENIKMARLAAIGETSSMVVHELKNILQLARLSEEMLQMGLRDNNPKFITMGNKKIQHALKEMDGFIWEMLSLARDQKLETASFKLEDFFIELEDDLQVKTKSSNAILVWDVPQNFPAVNADRRALYRAILNLVKNAYEAKKGTDSITVTLRVEKVDAENYRIDVEDTGEGMSAETRARLFQAFYTTKGERGTGLGLMVVANTVRLHRGTIDVISELGRGTCFKINLPFTPLVALINQVRNEFGKE